MRRAASTASWLDASRLKNQIPGLPPAVTYVRTLSSRKLETRGSGSVPRRRRALILNGVIPSQAAPSWVWSRSASGTSGRSASASTRQCAKRRSSQVCPIRHEPGGSGHGRWAVSRREAACRALAEAAWEDGVEEGADRARRVDGAEADRRAERRRPRPGAERLHAGRDRERRSEQEPVRRRRRMEHRRSGSVRDDHEGTDRRERDRERQADGEEAPGAQQHVNPSSAGGGGGGSRGRGGGGPRPAKGGGGGGGG